MEIIKTCTKLFFVWLRQDGKRISICGCVSVLICGYETPCACAFDCEFTTRIKTLYALVYSRHNLNHIKKLNYNF